MSQQAITVTHSSQIKDLPWVGNFAQDGHLFEAIHKYLNTPGLEREELRSGHFEMGLYGMGYDEPIDDEELEQLIIEAKDYR